MSVAVSARALVAAAATLLALALPAAAAPNIDTLLDDAIEGKHRSEANRARDPFRRPKMTLLFFGLQKDMSVVEISPSAGWYTEIIAPALKEGGRYIAAVPKVDDKTPEAMRQRDAAFREKLASGRAIYGNAQINAYDPASPTFAPAGSADLVVTFRNVHNWAKAGHTDAMFKGFFNALKKGGVLGVVEHRAKPGTDLKQQIDSGYMTEDLVIEAAERAGFKFDAASELNSNWRDTKDHPGGVWNLPPNLRGVSDADKPKYQAIGESDRMTLRFVKP
ncbi:MAG: methyltransferase [Burkholderiaceae bacterium]|nr:methyltransferase [Burkholderiaceae bacterium]